jgi:pyridoxine/pyridoxamine 5'-phosphate oxidase
MGERELSLVAREIVDEIAYMTIASVDPDGKPWASPVWFAHEDYTRFHWISRPEARHSQNIAAHRRVAIVIFDSRTPIDTGRGVYVEAEAEEVTDENEIERMMTIFSERSVAQGGATYTAADVQAPAHLRPYRATALKIYLGIDDRRTEVALGDE